MTKIAIWDNISEKTRRRFVEEEIIYSKIEKLDTGLACLMTVANYHEINFKKSQIQHNFLYDGKNMSTLDILRVAKKNGLKSKFIRNVRLEKLYKLTLPVIVENIDGDFLVVAGIKDEKMLIFDPYDDVPKQISTDEFLSFWSGKVILFTPRNENFTKDSFGLKWFIPSIIKYKKTIMETLIAVFTIQIFTLGTPLIMQVIIDKVLVHRSLNTLNVLAIGLAGIIMLETILSFAKNYVFVHTTSKIDILLGSKIYEHLFKLPLKYFETRRVGVTIARVREIENIREFLTGSPLTSVLDILFIAVYVAVMVFYSPNLTWIVLGTLPFFILLSAIITPLFRYKLDEVFYYGSEEHSFLVESVSGVQTIKSFALEPKMQRKWDNILTNYVKSSFKLSMLSKNASLIGDFIRKSSDLIILWYGAKLVMLGRISVGQLIAFRMLSGHVSEPVLRMVQMWQDFQQTKVSVDKLSDIFNTKPEHSLDSSKTDLPDVIGEIKFKNVSFRYKLDSPEVIRNLSFEIEPGKTVGIVGRSGSGKSTVSKLVQRLYIPERGKIFVDGMDISFIDPAWLRRQIGVVLQDNFLFNGTVKENIAINKQNADMKEIVEVAKLAGAHEFILGLSEGYDTPLGENGTALSGGQKQRVAIARSLLTNPKILIFDEATSALDYESETIIQNNLKDICKGRTVIIIAHRLSTLKDADEIMVIDSGELVEYDSHDKLLEVKGLYHYLYTQQERGVAS